MTSTKDLLEQDNQKKYNDFLLNEQAELTLLAPSFMPGIAVSSKRDKFKKETIYGPQKVSGSHLNFIKKNEKPHTFTWHSSAENIQKGVRWGIITPQSVTGQAIAALGQYRIAAHERVFKGMISKTQILKIKLLDHYQARFELLQALESLVNQNNTQEDYKTVIEHYIQQLNKMADDIQDLLQSDVERINPKIIMQLKNDINNDIQRATTYLSTVLKRSESKPLRAHNRARGHESVLSFIKQQMLHNLYEFQGINQDITYSRNRRFALTRGVLNDAIEDARKVIDDYGADMRNGIMGAHHGRFSEQPDTDVIYDFAKEKLSPKRERDVLMAISFIEGWDQVEQDQKTQKLHVKSGDQTESLSVVYATNWRKHRHIKAFFKNLGYYLLNVLKGILLPTKAWREEAWESKTFHLHAWTLMAHATSREPLWIKPFKLLKMIGQAVIDVFKGVADFGKDLVIRMPADLFNDWAYTNQLGALTDALETAGKEIEVIRQQDKEKLDQLFERTQVKQQVKQEPLNDKVDLESEPSEQKLLNVQKDKPVFAQLPYSLHFGEQNDILNAVVRGVEGFSDVFTHNIFAKDPVAGLLFTAAYAAGGAVIFFPAFSKALFGATYTNWFSSVSHAMGSTKVAATIAGGSTQAQAIASTWDVCTNGPGSLTLNAVSELIEDPVTAGSAFMVAYGLGYVLANGIAGHSIPWLSHVLKEDLGSSPEIGYPLVGAKVAISLYEALVPGHTEEYKQLPLIDQESHDVNTLFVHKDVIERFFLAHWLNQNADILPRLKRASQALIARHIEKIFSAEDAAALKKLIYPEKKSSIAFQLFVIPLSYIPAILRVLFSVFLSLTAWCMEKPHPWEPFKQSIKALGKKIRMDLNRLLMLAASVIHFSFKMISIFCKMLVFVLNMLIGRIAGLIFNQPVAHAMHRAFAAVHVFFRTVGEFLYPARAAKCVEVAHPAHVIQMTQTSYGKMLGNLKLSLKKGQKENQIISTIDQSQGLNKDKEQPVNEEIIEISELEIKFN